MWLSVQTGVKKWAVYDVTMSLCNNNSPENSPLATGQREAYQQSTQAKTDGYDVMPFYGLTPS